VLLGFLDEPKDVLTSLPDLDFEIFRLSNVILFLFLKNGNSEIATFSVPSEWPEKM
jgi:hypothetical protein